MTDCQHINILRHEFKRRWTCSDCGEPFEPWSDSVQNGMFTQMLFCGEAPAYWLGLKDRIRELEGEKYALGQQLAARQDATDQDYEPFGVYNLKARAFNPGEPVFDHRCIEVAWEDALGGHVHQIPLHPSRRGPPTAASR